MFYTYFHTRNDTNSVFYVGKGRELRAHAKHGRNPHWHNIVKKCGHTVHFAMCGLTEQEAFDHEKFLILCFKDMGEALVNMTDGGDGVSGLIHTESTKLKLSALMKEARNTPEARAQLKITMNKPETVEKLRVIVASQWADPLCRAKHQAGMDKPETKLKQSRAVKELLKNPEILKSRVSQMHTIESLSKRKAILGSPEERLKNSLRTRERFSRVEECEKVRRSAIARWARPEEHEKMVEAAKARWSDPAERVRKSANMSGRKWITDGRTSKLIKPDADIPEGWHSGRAVVITYK